MAIFHSTVYYLVFLVENGYPCLQTFNFDSKDVANNFYYAHKSFMDAGEVDYLAMYRKDINYDDLYLLKQDGILNLAEEDASAEVESIVKKVKIEI